MIVFEENKQLKYFQMSLLNTLKRLTGFKVLRKVNLNDCNNMLIALLYIGRTPSGSKGHFLEVYRKDIIPFLTKPMLQCSYELSGSLIGCRLRNNEETVNKEILSKLLSIPEKDLVLKDDHTLKKLYILCGHEIVFSTLL